MWLPTEVLLWEAAQAGPGGQFSAAITFCVSSVISASLQCHTSTRYTRTLYASEKEIILALFS